MLNSKKKQKQNRIEERTQEEKTNPSWRRREDERTSWRKDREEKERWKHRGEKSHKKA